MRFKKLLSADPLYPGTALGIGRILTGVFMVYHGWEIFDDAKMIEYTKWMVNMKLYSPSFMAYLGKVFELVCGILMVIGLFTRIAVIPLAMTMIFICFAIGKGRIFMEDQHPFLFVLLFFLFFFYGPGNWSLDKLFFSRQNNPGK